MSGLWGCSREWDSANVVLLRCRVKAASALLIPFDVRTWNWMFHSDHRHTLVDPSSSNNSASNIAYRLPVPPCELNLLFPIPAPALFLLLSMHCIMITASSAFLTRVCPFRGSACVCVSTQACIPFFLTCSSLHKCSFSIWTPAAQPYSKTSLAGKTVHSQCFESMSMLYATKLSELTLSKRRVTQFVFAWQQRSLHADFVRINSRCSEVIASSWSLWPLENRSGIHDKPFQANFSFLLWQTWP